MTAVIFSFLIAFDAIKSTMAESIPPDSPVNIFLI